MDGRQLRRWLICGGLAAALTGCKTGGTTLPDTVVGAKTGQPVGLTAGKSMWGGSAPKTDTPLLPGEGSPAPVASGKKKPPLSPEAQCAMTEGWVASACTEPPPPDRDQILDRARQTYQSILKKDPKNGPALLGMARMYARVGDREHALEQYRTYLKAKPTDHAVMAEVAGKHFAWTDYAGAVAWYDEALKVDPQNRTYRKSKGFCLGAAGRWDEALASLTQLVPEPEARLYVAKMLADMKQMDQSRQQVAAALQMDPNLTAAREFLAVLDRAAQPQQAPQQPGEANPIYQAGATVP
jgi:thioredoxin-like negative regulator of GroEL